MKAKKQGWEQHINTAEWKWEVQAVLDAYDSPSLFLSQGFSGIYTGMLVQWTKTTEKRASYLI